MKKLILIVAWVIHLYSGDHGHLSYVSKDFPKFLHGGRWVHFVDKYNREHYISGSSTIVIKETE